MSDSRFGVALVPDEIQKIEKSEKPRSRQMLTGETALALKAYFEAADNGLLLPQVNHDVLPILWVVDEKDQIWFAMEEVVSLADSAFMYPLSRKFAVPDGHAKLGHPSLLGGDYAGRIGGEIRYDRDFGERNWVISNKSGRYGFGATREETHLENVAAEFANVGIMLETYYIKPGVR